MIIYILLLFIGFILLIIGADWFVEGASSTAQNFKVSKTLIGITIVAFGTSISEFAVSMNALSTGSSDMVFGNAIGSCIFNSLLILGVAAVVRPIKVKDNFVKKELPLCLLFSTALVVLFLDVEISNGAVNEISRSDGIVILLFFSIFLYYLITLTKQKKAFINNNPKFKLGKSLLLVVVGLLGVVIGSNLVVNNALEIAKTYGVSERIIALTVITFGTSLPEFVTTIVSARKGEQDLLLGNIIGSNIFNICIVLGLPVVIFGNITISSFHFIDLVILIGSSFMLWLFADTKKVISRVEGFLMLLAFAIYYILVFII